MQTSTNSTYQATASGSTFRGFKPYRGNDVKTSDYKQIVIAGLGNVWARMTDGGADAEKRTLRDTDGTALHIQPRFTLLILGWGADAGEKCFFHYDFNESAWAQIKAELASHTTEVQ